MLTGVQPSQLGSVIALLCRSDLRGTGVTEVGNLNARGGLGHGIPGAKWHSPTKGRRWWMQSQSHSEDGPTHTDLRARILENPAYHELVAFSDALHISSKEILNLVL